MPAIESYSFGRMQIDGVSFTKDVIIFPDGKILSPWWRKQGHVLATEDLAGLFAAEPEIIICGTGALGVMQPSAELQKYIENSAIRFIAQKSGKAVETYNQLSGREKVGACFHLTC
jgi:hypothetical protein